MMPTSRPFIVRSSSVSNAKNFIFQPFFTTRFARRSSGQGGLRPEQVWNLIETHVKEMLGQYRRERAIELAADIIGVDPGQARDRARC